MSSSTRAHFLRLFTGILLSVAVRGEESLREQLAKQFLLTKVANDGSVVTAGSSLVLHKDGLMTYSIVSPQPALNTWKDGKMAPSFSRNMAIGIAMKNNGLADLPKRKFVSGELLWVIGIGVEKDGVVFRLLSDAYDGIRYCGDLKFPFPKGSAPALDQAVRQINEVLTIQVPDKPATQAPPPAAPPPPAVAAPPPVAEVQTVSLGDTPDRVVAALGQPKNIVKLGPKQIYIYPNLKVTFENGKVTDVQ